MSITHSTITTSSSDGLVCRHECPACGFTLETTASGVGALVVERGDASVGHTWDGQAPHLVLR